MIRRTLTPLTFICIWLLAVSAVLPLRAASAAPHALTGGEVMAAVNALRQSQGLQPYAVDAGISAYAQEHSEYQARINQSTHLHSDGVVSLAHGLVENVAGGDIGYLTAQAIVYEVWNDPVHGKTMTGYESGAAGVGVASNSTTTFVTLNVRPGDGKGTPALPGGTPGLGLTPIALVPLTTVTMKSNGAIIHEVGYGQSLWAIAMAYGVSGARIRQLNGMAADDSAIWAGQRLLIVPAGEVTPTPPPAAGDALEAAPTASAPAPLALILSPTPAPTGAPLPAQTARAPLSALARRLDIDPVLAGLLGMAVLGLVLFLSSGVKIKRRPH